MKSTFKNISIFKEARMFKLKIWQTPSFLFLVMGLTTIATTYATFLVARKFDDLTFLIISLMGVTLVVFVSGVLLVRVISKIIIINSARTEFLSLVTHQLRSPLTGTKYIFEIVLSEKVGPVNPNQKELLVQGSDSNERMLMMVADLLDIAKMAEGDSPFKFEKVQFESLVKEIEQHLSTNAKAKKVELKLHLPEQKLPEARLDRKKIRFVLQNLVDNAIKYTDSGGQVVIEAKLVNRKIQVSVKDSGIGIPEDEQVKLFTKFYRATNAEQQKKTGTGLGLYIAKNVVERHGGEIWFESKLNQGSIFYFTVPLKPRGY